jgi:hypothetical protein
MLRIRLAIDPPGVREHIVSGSGDVASVSRREIAILATRYEGHFHDVLDSPTKRSSSCSEVARILSPQGTDSGLHRIPCRHSGEAHPIPLSEAFPSSAVFLWAVDGRAESGAENAGSETSGPDRAL